MTPLSEFQAQVLGMVVEHGGQSVSDVASGLLVSDAKARSAIDRLEWRGLLLRNYTGTSLANNRARFTVSATRKGADLARYIFEELA